MKPAIVLAILGALAVAYGAGMWFLPAGWIVGGLELITGAYVIRYWEARR